MRKYAKAATEAIAKYGGRALVRGGSYEAVEGQARGRNVVVEFDSVEAAKRFCLSDDYQGAKKMREYAATIEYGHRRGV